MIDITKLPMEEAVALAKAHLELANKIKKSINEFGGNSSADINLNNLMGKHYMADVSSLLEIIEKLMENNHA